MHESTLQKSQSKRCTAGSLSAQKQNAGYQPCVILLHLFNYIWGDTAPFDGQTDRNTVYSHKSNVPPVVLRDSLVKKKWLFKLL